MFKEFREFALKGNVVDMAVGIIIGASFGKIVSSIVSDIFMPPIGMLMGKMDFSKLSFVLQKESTDAAGNKVAEVAVKYGTFINTVLDFVIVAFVMFIIVKQMNRLKRQQEPAPVTTKDCPQCLSPIPLKATRCAHCTATL